VDAFVIHGGKRLSGRITINGSKNAALPLLATSLMTDQPVTLRNVPRLADINNMRRLLAELGVTESETEAPDGTRNLTLRAADESNSHARYDIVRTMRASICVLGPMLARRGYARVSMPGGCAIGDRPVDLHLRGMEALGAEVTLDAGDIIVRAPATGRLRGARIFLGGPFGPTVLGTSNVMCAAALAEGTTIIESAACEPECVDVARLLTAMGARITGAGTPRIVIEGVEELHGADHNVMPDRIEAGTYMMAAAITGGRLVLDNCPIDCLLAAVDRLEHMGVHVKTLSNGKTTGKPADADRYHASVEVTRDRVMRPVQVTTQPHPGFPTDLQAQLMALLCLAQGNSVVTETIFAYPGMGKLIYQNQVRVSCQSRIQIKLDALGLLMIHDLGRELFQTFQLHLGIGQGMGFH